MEEQTAKLKKEILERRRAEDKIKELKRELERRVEERTAELEKAVDEQKKQDAMKDSFLSSVSHEFRAPLTSIRSFSEILLQYENEDPEMQREFLHIINSESERLSRLVNDLLDLSQIEAGRMVYRDAAMSLEEAIRETARIQFQSLCQKSLRLHLDFPLIFPMSWRIGIGPSRWSRTSCTTRSASPSTEVKSASSAELLQEKDPGIPPDGFWSVCPIRASGSRKGISNSSLRSTPRGLRTR